MKGKLWVPMVVAVALLSACNDGSAPTDAGRDLLSRPSNGPVLGDSKYGQIYNDGDDGGGDDDTDPCSQGSTYEPVAPPVTPVPGSPPPEGYEHISGGDDNTKAVPPCHVHISEATSSQQERDSSNVSKYKPKRRGPWVHITRDQARFDGTDHATKYKPNASDHVSDAGANKTKYRRSRPL